MTAHSSLASGPIAWPEVAEAPVTSSIAARTLLGQQMSATTFELAPGAVIPRHAHPNEELGIVLRGQLRMRCDDAEFTVGPGQTFFVAAETPHDGVALDEGCTLLECYAPPRIPAPASEESSR